MKDQKEVILEQGAVLAAALIQAEGITNAARAVGIYRNVVLNLAHRFDEIDRASVGRQ